MRISRLHFLPVLVLTAAVIAGCGNDNPIAPFEPEVVTDADAFQFQITDAHDVTTTVEYVWTSSGDRVSVDHSTATNGGQATVSLVDAAGATVYQSGLMASGNETSAVGTAGQWTVVVAFRDFDGTANFRVEPI